MSYINFTFANYCSKIKHILHLSKFIHPACIIAINNSNGQNDVEDWYNALYNPHMCLLIIQDMCIGIFIPDHIAKRFGYLTMILERNEYKTLKQKTSCKVITINSKWDTSKWSYGKISRFYHDMFHLIENTTIENIKQDNSAWKLEKLDIPFLEALCWN